MKLDRNSNMPLYLQLKNAIIERIRSGELKPGSAIQTEDEFCMEYGISRYPVRQALGELVSEGYLSRTRGRGTFISEVLPEQENRLRSKIVGLVLNQFSVGFEAQILAGFEKQARKRGYIMAACCSESVPDEEISCIDRLIESGAGGLFLCPCSKSRIASRIERLKAENVVMGILDRNPGLADIDYVGSDNTGGAYMAVRHLAEQGFINTVFVSDVFDISSVMERMEGYLKGVEDFMLNPLSHINIEKDISRHTHIKHSIILEDLRNEIVNLKDRMPLGIFAANDFIALRCMDICRAEGLVIGKDVAIIGFDNIPESNYQDIQLTTIAQNGLLLGQNAADILINKLEGKTSNVYSSIVPTQLIVRNSCGEKG